MSLLNKTVFYHYIEDLLLTPEVLSMNAFIQHGNITTLQHVLCVAWITYVICRALFKNPREPVRAALLHDFYLYDWHDPVNTGGGGHQRFHGFTHPGIALKNASRLFPLSEREKDTIRKHMWPLTIIPPRYSDGFIVCLADKICATQETFHLPSRAQDVSLSIIHQLQEEEKL